MKLFHLRKNRAQIEQIIALYLPSYDRLWIGRSESECIFSVDGIGSDGERQFLTVTQKGEPFRGYMADDESVSSYLPVEKGKVFSMLLDFGYELPNQQTIQGRRYKKYISTGASFLGKY